MSGHVIDLGFNLQSGMLLTWELGQINREQLRPHIFLGNPDSQPRVYMASLRLWNRDPVVIFNTKLRASGYGLEERSAGRIPKNNSHFTIDIEIGGGVFQTHLDGSPLMTNKMRAPFDRVRFVGVDRFAVWYKLRVRFDKC